MHDLKTSFTLQWKCMCMLQIKLNFEEGIICIKTVKPNKNGNTAINYMVLCYKYSFTQPALDVFERSQSDLH